MKKKLLVLLLSFTSYNLVAQDRISVAIIPITFDQERVSASDARIIQETVLNTFVASKRFTVVDREKLQEIEKEKKLQKSEAFMDSQGGAKDGVSKGASVLIATNVVSIRHSQVAKGFESAINLQVKILDVSTGEILATENISSELVPIEQLISDARKKHLTKDEEKVEALKEAQLKALKPHQEDAFMVALQRLGENIKKFNSMNFPVSLTIVEFDKKQKDLFLLAGGNKIGLHRGQLLDIVKITEAQVGGKTVERKQKLAMAWITSVDDENFSKAIVLDENKEYKAAKKANDRLAVLTR
jgi:hypothetical protein